MPITWKNVDTPNFTGVSDMMEKGVNSISGAIGGAHDVLEDHWNKTKQQNTDRYAAEIMAAQDMDSVANLRASLTPDQLNSRYEGQIDTVGLMGALQDQGRFVRQDTMEQKQFEDFNETRDWRNPIADVLLTARSEGADAGLKAKQNLLDAGAPQWLVTEISDSIYNQGRQETQDKMSLEQHGWNKAGAARQAEEFRWKGLDRLQAEKEKLNLNGFERARNELIRNNPNATSQEMRDSTNSLAEEFGVSEKIRLGSLEDIPRILAANFGDSEEHRNARKVNLEVAARETLFNGWNNFVEENEGNIIPDDETIRSWGNEFLAGIADKEGRAIAEENYSDLVRILNQVPQEERAARFQQMTSFEEAWREPLREAQVPITELTNQMNNMLFKPQQEGEGAKSPGEAMWGLLSELGLADDSKTRSNINNGNFSVNYNRVYDSVASILDGASEFDIQNVVKEVFTGSTGSVSAKDRSGVTIAGTFNVDTDLLQTLNGLDLDYQDLLYRVLPELTERYIREKDQYPDLQDQLNMAQSNQRNIQARKNIEATIMFGSSQNN